MCGTGLPRFTLEFVRTPRQGCRQTLQSKLTLRSKLLKSQPSSDWVANRQQRPVHRNQQNVDISTFQSDGRVSEWFKEPVLKTGVRETVPWVRIPPLPPYIIDFVVQFPIFARKVHAYHNVRFHLSGIGALW